MNHFIEAPAFSAGARSYTWSDAVLAAILRGEWTGFVEQSGRRRRDAASAETRGEGPSEKELEAAAGEFRYDRDLITAEEMEAWLEHRGLTVEAWLEHVERALCAPREENDREPEDEGGTANEDDEDDEDDGGGTPDALVADLLCSGVLERFAADLAARVAIDDGAPPGPAAPSPDAIGRLVGEFSEEIASWRALGFSASDERLAELARLELVFRGRRSELSSGPAVRAQIDAHRLDWVRVDLQGLSFRDEAAAREAALCLREDGDSIETVAENAHVRMREEVVYLDEMDPVAKPDILSARPGELVGPVAFGERFHVYLLRGKTMPSEDDPGVRRRAEDALLAKTVEHETSMRIRWVGPR